MITHKMTGAGVQIGHKVVDPSSDELRFVPLAPGCTIESEIDKCVDSLIDQLNKVREKAKKGLRT